MCAAAGISKSVCRYCSPFYHVIAPPNKIVNHCNPGLKVNSIKITIQMCISRIFQFCRVSTVIFTKLLEIKRLQSHRCLTSLLRILSNSSFF